MRLAILCSGQAGQHEQMLDDFLVSQDCAALRNIASDILKQDVAVWWRSLNATQIFTNANAQFAIALYQIATWQRIGKLLPRPAVVAGYSMGEVIAWHVAGSIDATTTLQLIRARAAAMDQYAPSGMLGRCLILCRGRSAPATRIALQQAMKTHGLSVAIYRTNGDLVLGGTANSITAFRTDPAVQHASLRCLPVFVPSHTAWLNDAVRPFHDVVESSLLSDPSIPVLSGVDGMILRKGSDAAVALSAQLAQAIHWDWCQDTIAALGVDVALELGPGNDLAKMIADNDGVVAARSVDEFNAPESLQGWLRLHT